MADARTRPAGAQETGANGLHGLLRIGSLPVALPAQVIREVVPCPAELATFPASIPEVVGAMELRGQMIPVLDLQRLLNMGGDAISPAERIVVVIRHGGRVHGAIANGIDGVTNLPESATASLEIAGPGVNHAIVRATFVHGALSGVILDSQTLASLPGLPTVEDLASLSGASRQTIEPTMVFTVAGMQCALPADCVDACLPSQELLAAPVGDALWIAMLRHNGFEIPVIDTLALLGQGQLPPGRGSGGAIVLRCDPSGQDDDTGAGAAFGLVALLIDSVDDIVRVEADRLVLLDDALAQAPFARGVIEFDSGPCLLLDGAGIASDERIVRIGTIRQKPAAPASSGSGAIGMHIEPDEGQPIGPHGAFLVFTVEGTDFAAPLGDIDEILSCDEPVLELRSPRRDVVGILPRRGRGIPVMDFGGQLGLPERKSRNFTIIARTGQDGEDQRTGFLVDALRSVDRAVLQRLNARPGIPKGTDAPLSSLDLTIRLGNGKACSVLDLARISRQALGSGIEQRRESVSMPAP